MSRAPVVDGPPRETTSEAPSVDAELARALDTAHHVIGTSNGGPGWRHIVDTLRRNPDGILSAAAKPGRDSDAVRESVLLTLALVAGPGDDPGIARRLERTAERAARGDIERDRLWSAVATTLRLVWEEVAAAPVSRAELVHASYEILERFAAARSALDGAYAEVDRAVAASDAEARRAFLDELLMAPPQDRLDALRRRRRAERHGIDAERSYRLTLISAGPRSSERTVERMIVSLRRDTARPRPASNLRFALPEISEWRGRAVVVDTATPDHTEMLRAAFEIAARRGPANRWVAITGPEVAHVDQLAESMERLREAVRTAERVGRIGWIASANDVVLETLLSLDEDLRTRAIDAELGPILRDTRSGSTLVETLEVYFAYAHNAHEAARRLHVAPRTIAYRLARVEQLLGHQLDAGTALRVGVALFAYRLDDKPWRHGGKSEQAASGGVRQPAR
jgi:hypothetical protein